MASDNGEPSKTATATLSVSIIDVNDNKPLFDKTLIDYVADEGTPVGDCFLTVNAKDDDCGENGEVEYGLEDAEDHFTIGKMDGTLCLARSLDFEAAKVHTFIVTASDRGGLSSTAQVRIAVTDKNDNVPEFAPTVYMAKINRDLALNVPIATVMASDADSGSMGEVSYSIVAGNEAGNFALGSTSGTLYLARRLDGTASTFRLRIAASDGEGKKSSNEASLIVQVTEDAIPFGRYQYEFNVPEDVSPYSQIGRISPSVPGDFRFSLTDQSTSGYFSLDARSGVVRSESRLDHEAHPQVVLNILAEDARATYHIQAIVNVRDVNDNAPEFPFPKVSVTIPEVWPTSKVLYTASATDLDSGSSGEIRYRLLSKDNDGLFSLDESNGQIRLTSSLDFEDKQQHNLVIEATDGGQPRLRSTLKLTINVFDWNDNAPVFDKEQYRHALAETHIIGTPILTVKATDADSGKNGRLTYTVSQNNFVSVLPNSGVLILTNPVDREADPTISVVVTASDNGVPVKSATASIVLTVSDKNDQTPKFEANRYNFGIQENRPIGTVVGDVVAVDNDDGPNGQVEYRFRTPVSQFTIESASGRIKTRASLDREERDSYELLVEALDQGTPQRSAQVVVTIEVGDENDSEPKLASPVNKMLYVPKSSSRLPTASIGRIVGADQDLNDRLTYELVGK